MSEDDDVLSRPPPLENVSAEVEDYLQRLRALADFQKKELEAIGKKSERLEQKLRNVEAYNEELREQVKVLSDKLSQQSKCQKCTKDETAMKASKESPPDVMTSENDDETDPAKIVEQIKQAASEVARDQFLQSMTYEETSGLYYDYRSGYYFDAERSLYYDGTTGTYYSYNYDTKSYEIHSQVETNFGPTKTKKKSGKRKKEARADSGSDVKRSRSDSAESKDSKGPAPASPKSPSKTNDDSSSSEPEDGEIATTSDDDDDDASQQDAVDRDVGFVPPPTPCVRIVVVESPELLTVGKLFIVTCTGGSVGREGDHDVLLSDEVGCSKVHARISHKEDRYFVTDVGSSNGTFVNGHRLSNAKKESEPREIGHGSVLQIGATKLLCHVHPGRETCFECEPGLVQVKPKATETVCSVSKEKDRKKAMKELRKKYGLASGDGPGQPKGDGKYEDRAKQRRRHVGSDNPYEKTESSHLDKSIDGKNKGFKMLQKMGWKEGSGLGKEASGRLEPVPVAAKNDRAGLGDAAPKIELDFKAKQKSELWRKTQTRFSKTAVLDAFNVDDDEEEGSAESAIR